MKNKIKFESSIGGQKYVVIYEVHLVSLDAVDVVYMRYFDKSKALEDVSFMRRHHSDMYRSIYVESNLVWC